MYGGSRISDVNVIVPAGAWTSCYQRDDIPEFTARRRYIVLEIGRRSSGL